MAHVAISSDLMGSIYAIDHNGDLYRNQHTHADGTGSLIHPGLGERIGSGWGDVHHFTAMRLGDRTFFAGLGPNAELVTGSVPVSASAQGSSVAAPRATPGSASPGRGAAVPSQAAPLPDPTAPLKLRSVFAGSGGALYMVTRDGALLRQTVIAQAQPAGEVVTREVEVIEPAGWANALTLFTNGDGVFFQIALNGNLRYQNTSATQGRPSKDAWLPLARAWSRYPRVMAAGNGGIYTICSEGTLELRRYTIAPNGEVQLAPRRRSDVIGSGFHPWGGLAADIEAYGWPMSLLPGDTIDVKVGIRLSTPPEGTPAAVSEPAYYTVDFRRLRRMHGSKEGVYDEIKPTPFAGKKLQAARYELPSDWLATGAGWTEGFSLTIPDLPKEDPNHWRPGIYAARCSDSSGRAFYAPFVLRPKSPQSPFAVIANTNTWNAYNSWGGQGKYTHTYPVPNTLPFKRPHPGLTPDVVTQTPDPKFLPYGPSVLTNTCHLLRAELWVLGWLEDLGPRYAYDVYTDRDLHVGNTGIGDSSLPRYKGLILNTHPEYWTREMYDRVRTYRDQGGSIIYLGGNGIYEEVVLSTDGAHMGIFPGLDRSKFPTNCTNEQLRLYCLMRSPGVARPEHALIGVGFQNCEQANPEGQPYQLMQNPAANGANPVLAGVHLKVGASLGATSLDVAPPDSSGAAIPPTPSGAANPPTPNGAATPPTLSGSATPPAPSGAATPPTPSGAATPPTPSDVIATYEADGWEVDQRGNGTPPQAYATEALLALGSNASLSGEMICFKTDMGGVVFAAASLNFGGSLVVDPNLQRMVQNALDQCLAR